MSNEKMAVIVCAAGAVFFFLFGFIVGRCSKRGTNPDSGRVGESVRRAEDINRELADRESRTAERLREQAGTIDAIAANNRKIEDLIGRAKEILHKDDGN